MSSDGQEQTAHRLRGLWIAREHPFPLNTGDHIYTARLLQSVAAAGVDLSVTGFVVEGLPTEWPVRWMEVSGKRNSPLRALFSLMPLVAASHRTPTYRRLVSSLAKETWDFVVVDQYGMGWALEAFTSHRDPAKRPVIVHVAHDHEASVYESLIKSFRGSLPKRLVLWQNWIKTRVFERRLARSVDLISAITDEDAQRFSQDAPRTPTIVLTPGYDGVVSTRACIEPSTPRHVVMVGSYHWVAKQENLRQFVAAADPVFTRHGILLHIIGGMPEALARDVRNTTKATVVHGFVDDIAPHFANARLAVVAEEIGGGFKLKFLDYIFGRVPVATLSHAAAGLPAEVRRNVICSVGLDDLVAAICTAIDDLPTLNELQTAALAAAQLRFHWRDRGEMLVAAVVARARLNSETHVS